MSKDTNWNHDPVAVIRKVETPMLWVLAGEDREAPVADSAPESAPDSCEEILALEKDSFSSLMVGSGDEDGEDAMP